MSSADTPAVSPIGRVAMVVVGLLSLIGIAISLYMTWHHEVELYGGQQVVLWGCAETAGVDCGLVNTSAWSEVLGIPQFTLAIPAYIATATLATLIALGRRRFIIPLAIFGVVAAVYSVFLGAISYIELDTWCLWCVRLYLINFAIPLLTALANGRRAPLMPSIRELGIAGAVWAATAVVSVGAQQAYRTTLLGDAADIDLDQRVSSGARAEMPDGRDPMGDLEPRTVEVITEAGRRSPLELGPDDAWKGNPDASVTVVEFADFQCGYCKRASYEIDRLYEAYGDDVLFVFKHYPMDRNCNTGVKSRKHRYACEAAAASACAQKQGAFWRFHDLAFKNQHELKPPSLIAYAEASGVDIREFKQCMRDRSGNDDVTDDTALGASLEIGGTPRIFIQGDLYRAGTSAQRMAAAIEKALGNAAADKAAADKVALEKLETRPVPTDLPEMAEIKLGDLHFLIDTFESALEEGSATTGKHVVPATRMSWFAANDACKAAGKRMCTDQEWIAVCQGAAPVDDDDDGLYADDMIEGNAYNYGDFHDPRRCWASRNRETERPVYTGEMPGCVGELPVYDLVGNVEEWVGTTPEDAVLLGGAFDTPKDKARCYRRNDTFGPGFANLRTGFRCCADPEATP